MGFFIFVRGTELAGRRMGPNLVDLVAQKCLEVCPPQFMSSAFKEVLGPVVEEKIHQPGETEIIMRENGAEKKSQIPHRH